MNDTLGLLEQDEVVRLQERIAAVMAAGGQGKDVEGGRDQEAKPIRGRLSSDLLSMTQG